MPWKGEKDPYRIWLSEIILQQTRVEQGLRYYNDILGRFPTVDALASAKDTEVFKLWEGLGYYSRCRNLLHTARVITSQYNGQFPASYQQILALKGIGPYTAAAISSFAFGQPYAVVDGNVIRIIARLTGSEQSADSGSGKKYFASLAQDWLDKKKPGLYNQAIMDFGATVCKPVAPLCQVCPFNQSCYAYKNEVINILPIKARKLPVKKRWFNYFVLKYKNQYAVTQRNGDDIWQQLYEFPNLETERMVSHKQLIISLGKNYFGGKLEATAPGQPLILKQQLTHQLIHAQFIEINCHSRPKVEGWNWVTSKKINELPFPRVINEFRELATRLS
jgi:A/G-specific adenine glycosylase